MQVWKIDENNIFIGESYFVKEPKTNEITAPLTVGHVKSKWTGIEWIEGATQEEIQTWKDSQVVELLLPTTEERITALEEVMLMML